jgi:hypothetical protein
MGQAHEEKSVPSPHIVCTHKLVTAKNISTAELRNLLHINTSVLSDDQILVLPLETTPMTQANTGQITVGLLFCV